MSLEVAALDEVVVGLIASVDLVVVVLWEVVTDIVKMVLSGVAVVVSVIECKELVWELVVVADMAVGETAMKPEVVWNTAGYPSTGQYLVAALVYQVTGVCTVGDEVVDLEKNILVVSY